jgi:predicted metalloprotease with PDZ domain
MADIHYRIDLADPASHRFQVTLTIRQPQAETTLSLPVWIPGSYMVREFGRHLSCVQARQGRQDVALRQLDKTTWQLACSGRAALVVSYEAYAFDHSVRTAFLDDRRGFFNPTSLCLRVHGREAQPHAVQIGKLPAGWEVATAMPAAPTGKQHYLSADYDELVDHPFELGSFWRGRFQASGVDFEFVVAGAWPGFDGERLLADTQRICTEQIRFWHGRRKPPFARYVFLLNVVEDGYGGLEHRASTALIANRRDLPRPGVKDAGQGYQTLLGLISHEFFHTWNVKRLKPAEFLQFDYSRENYTELLWFFEGFTSYYDDLMLVRAGLIDAPRYLKLLSRTLNGVAATPGRQVQSVAQSSFDAWVKYYRQDENTPNATVSYYTKGSLIALLLDLRLRQAGQATLDDLMRALWLACPDGGLTEATVFAQVEALAGAKLATDLAHWVHGTDELPLAEALALCGVDLQTEPAAWAASLGLRLSESPLTGVSIKSVLSGSAAAAAGLSAGDELLAVDGWRVRRFDDARQWVGAGLPFEVLVSRQQRLRSLTLKPQAHDPLATQHTLHLATSAKADAKARRKAWLGA